MMVTELDYMEYSSDALAQAAYVTNSGYDSNTKLYIRFDGSNGATTYTAETGQTVNFYGNWQLSTGTYKLGTSGATGSTNQMALSHSTDYTFGSGDFTIETWFRPAVMTPGQYYSVISKRANSSVVGDYLIFYDGSGNLLWLVGKDSTHWTFNRTVSSCVSINTWIHVAMVRNGNNFYLFLNGSLADSTTSSDAMYAAGTALYIGGEGDNDWAFNGHIDEVRLSNAARWTSAFTAPATQYQKVLQAYSESTIKDEGSYSLKGIADTSVINKTLTRTVSPAIDLTGVDTLRLDIYSSRTGNNIKIGIHDSGGTTTETTPNITSANTWQTVVWDISAVADANKDAIDSIIITIANAGAENIFYIDNFISAENVSVTAEPFIITTSLSSLGGIIVDGLGYVYEESISGAGMDVSLRTGSAVMKNILQRKNLKYIYHRINTHGKDVVMAIYIDGVAQTPTFTINTTTLTTMRIEDIPETWEGYTFEVEISCADVTDDDLEIYAPIALQLVQVGV
jgi:hypothetical protein